MSVPKFSKIYLESGTGDNTLVKKNKAQFDGYYLPNRVGVEIDAVDLSTNLFGEKTSLPFGVAPVGLNGLIWPQSLKKIMQLGKEEGFAVCQSTVSTESIEDTSEVNSSTNCFQLYMSKDDFIWRDILARASQAGFVNLIVTMDIPRPSIRPDITAAGIKVPVEWSSRLLLQALLKPRWTLATLLNGLPSLRTLEKYTKSSNFELNANFAGNRLGGIVTWQKLKEIKEVWNGPVIAKGITTPEDALKAVECGVDAIYVSNHGGRQLNMNSDTLTALKRIRMAVPISTKIFVDGGFSNAEHIIIALILGADYVFMGRSVYRTLETGDINRTKSYIKSIKLELENIMVQIGCEKIKDLKNINIYE